ncbi:proton channel OTOP3-like isoform X2 [Engystomops pustulosus]
MELKEPKEPITHEGFNLNYEQSWLHRHCRSPLIHHKRARGTGRLFSGLLAMNVVFLGAALISSVAISSMPQQNSYIFLSVLMFCSSVWALYHLLWTRRTDGAVEQDHHAGAIFLKVSLVLFGTCSLLVSVFKIGYDSSLFSCKLPSEFVFSIMKIIFIVIQTFLLWFSCRDCIQVLHNVSRWGIMLALATNLLLWLLAVTNDSVHREMESLHLNDTEKEEGTGCLCPKFSTCWTFQRGYVTLYPFNLEYSLIGASMLFIMWRNVGRRDVHHFGLSHPRFRLQGVLYGPVLGGAALLVGICIFIQYQVQASAGTVVTGSLVLYFTYSIILLSSMVVACVLGIIARTFRDKRHVELTRHDSENGEEPNKQSREKRQKESKECRHRNVEKTKDHGPSEGEAEEHKESNGVENRNFEDHEHVRYCTIGEEEKSQDKEKQEENGLSNVHIGIEELDKEHKMEHLNTHQTRLKFRTEKHTHHHEDISHGGPPKNYTRSLEIILLLGAALGQFSISYYSMVAIIATGSWTLLNILNLVYSIVMILQHMVQNVFIIEGMSKEHKEQYYLQTNKESKEDHEEAPRRLSMFEIRRASLAYLQSVGRISVSRRLVKEVALFLVLCNFMLWIMSAFGDHPQSANGVEQEYYGFSVWFSILNFGLPLSVFYRMHSVGGLLEVYVTA